MSSLDEFRPDPGNVRIHDARNRAAIEASIRRFGAARSIVVDEGGRVLAGNGALEAARAAGIREAIVVEADGDRLVVVRRRGLSGEEAAALAVTDNKTTDLSSFDYEALSALVDPLEEAGVPLVEFGWEDYELEPLRAADWAPPPPREGSLRVDTSGVTDPVRVDLAQRRLFERAAALARDEAGEPDMPEGEALAAICRRYLGEEGGGDA